MSRSSKSPNRDTPYKSLPVIEGNSSSQNLISKDKVKISIRVRPILDKEMWNDNIQIKQDNTIKIIKPDLDSITMQFDDIFSPKEQQEDIFHTLEDSIDKFLSGENQAFFAYGQTGAGKTYTMIGDLPENGSFSLEDMIQKNSGGILPRALDKILNFVMKEKESYKLMASFIEIYNEKIFDLLNPKSYFKANGLEIREMNGGCHVIDLLQLEIKNIESAQECLKAGIKNRITGSTHANTKSSRSHSIFQLVLMQPDPRDTSKMLTSKLRIVDLAGSEKFIIPKNISAEEKELRIVELTSINGSLSTLGHCITALTDAKRTHIPFRNSKLTRVLRDSLSGDSKISFIVCISPSLESTNETISTLQFASRAKRIILDGRHIRNKSEKKIGMGPDTNSYSDIFEILKHVMHKNGIPKEILANDGMKDKLAYLESELKDLREQNEELKNEVKQLKRSYSPDIFSKKSSSNFTTPQRNCPSQKNSGLLSPSRSDSNRNVGQGNSSRDQLGSRASIKSSSKSPFEKRVRFTEDCVTDRMKHEAEYHDDTIFKNLAIFKDVDFQDKKKSLSTAEIERLRSRNSNALKFWTYIDDDSDGSQEDKPVLLDKLFLKNKDKSNLLAQRIKQKEIERKYELFFSSMNKEKPKQKEEQVERSPYRSDSRNDSRNVMPVPQINRRNEANMSYIPSRNDANMSYLPTRSEPSIGDYHVGRPYNNETFNSVSSKSDYRISETLNFTENQTLHEKTNEEGSLLAHHEISAIIPQHSKIRNTNIFNIELLDEISEVDQTTGCNTYRSMNEAIEYGYGSNRDRDSLIHNISRRKNGPDYSFYHSEPREADKEIDNKSEEILKEFDKKLTTVHELNRKHQELIKNLDYKLAAFQKSSLSDLKYYEVNKSNTSAKSQNTSYNQNYPSQENIGKDVTHVVKELKKEVSNALVQIQNLQMDNSLYTQSKDYNSSPINDHKFSRDQRRNNDIRDKMGSYGPTERTNNLKSSTDIIKQHWSLFKENFKMTPHN